jgi:O-antigen/teichoic acid export membrane protein
MGHGRPVVVRFLEIGLFLVPLSAWVQLVGGLATGAQRWNLIIGPKLLSSVGIAAAVVLLRLVDDLTVTTVSVAYLTIGIVSAFPVLVVVRGTGPWHYSRRIAGDGLRFGLKSWVTTIAAVGNSYIDQVFMVALVSSRQLGLYALAVTVATASGSLVSATMNALYPRVAAGDIAIAIRACRVTVFVVMVFGLAIAVTSPWTVPFIWGSRFSGTVPMLVILLGASVVNAPGQVLGSALIAAGRPTPTATAQIVALVATVPALILLLPSTGGVGAAWISLAGYGIALGITLGAARRHFGLGSRELLLISMSDLRWLHQVVLRRPVASSLTGGGGIV